MKHDHNNILLKINGKAIQGLCDTGATRSVISTDLFKRLQLKITKTQLLNPFIPANGQPMCPLGQVSVNVNIQGLVIPSTFYVVNNLHPKLILGNDWRKSSKVVIDYRTGILSLFDDLILCRLKVLIVYRTVLRFNKMSVCSRIRRASCQYRYRTGIAIVQC